MEIVYRPFEVFRRLCFANNLKHVAALFILNVGVPARVLKKKIIFRSIHIL
jgi:hypothetical protein